MCIIERVHFIHPDGFREPKERLRHCQFGTPVTPCNDIRVFNVVDEVLYPAQKAPSPPHVRVMEPRATDRQHSPEHKKKPKKTYDDLKVVFDFHIPFASRHKKPESKPKKDSKKDPKEDGKMAQPGFPGYFPRPLGPQQLPPQIVYLPPRMHPGPPPAPLQDPPVEHTGGHVAPPTPAYSFSSTNSSPSPIFPIRVHRRPRPRSPSPNRHSKRDRERRRNGRQIEERERRQEERERCQEEREKAQERERRRRRREEEESQWKIQDQWERRQRQWAARIPGAPRHVAEIHHYHHYPEHNSFERLARDDFEQRGNQVLNEAIRARFEPRGPSGGPRLRRAIGGAERRIYDDQPRFGPRWL